jgi:hypothetical protein
MRNILRFSDYINESLLNESGVPVYVGSAVNPERTIRRNVLVKELTDLLGQVNSGALKEVSVLADIPTQGKNTPDYLKDIYKEMAIDDEGENQYDPETDVYTGDRDGEKNVFVDSEFIVKDIDVNTGTIIATPYSLKHKNVLIEISFEDVEEIFIK